MLKKIFKNNYNIIYNYMKDNPCKLTGLIVPYVVLNMIIKSKKYSFMTTAIPLTFSTIAFHYNLIKRIRNYDIFFSLVAYLHQILYYIIYTKKGGWYYYIFPGLLYLIDKVFEKYDYIKTSDCFHALCHISIIPCVYLNTRH